MLFRDLGLVVPELPVDPSEYWEQLSAEEVGKYQTDIVFNSQRGVYLTLEDLRKQPTYALHPAIKAGQVFPWSQDVIASYPGLAKILTNTANGIAASDSSVGAL
jgi:iron complex transport system substrate-binding protein